MEITGPRNLWRAGHFQADKLMKILHRQHVVIVLALSVIGLVCSQVEARDSMSCVNNNLTVENHSNRTVRINQVRWLNSAGDSWFSTPVDSGEIEPNGKWQTEFCMTGLEGGSTFVSIKYEVLLEDSPRVWSETQDGKQVHVSFDQNPVVTRLDVARRGL